MSFEYSIDPDVRCVVVRHFGEYQSDEEQRQIEAMCADARYQKGFDILRDVLSSQLPEDYNFKYFIAESRPQFIEIQNKIGVCKIAWVLGNGRDYGLVHQWVVSHRLSNTPVTRKPFRNMPDAFEWLGIPEDYEIKYPSDD